MKCKYPDCPNEIYPSTTDTLCDEHKAQRIKGCQAEYQGGSGMPRESRIEYIIGVSDNLSAGEIADVTGLGMQTVQLVLAYWKAQGGGMVVSHVKALKTFCETKGYPVPNI